MLILYGKLWTMYVYFILMLDGDDCLLLLFFLLKGSVFGVGYSDASTYSFIQLQQIGFISFSSKDVLGYMN